MKSTYRALRVVSVALIVSMSSAAMAAAQSTRAHVPRETAQQEADIARIVGYTMTRGGAAAFLETLTDTIGGRITGTAQSRAAADLILRTLKDAGIENAHFEEYDLATTWQPGPATGAVISPVPRELMIRSYGWVPGTPGAIEAPLVDFGAPDEGRVPQAAEQVRGAAVLIDLSADTSTPANVTNRHTLALQLAQAGAAAMIIVSPKPNRMQYYSAYLNYPYFDSQRVRIPMLSVPSDDAAVMRRLLAKGPVRLRLDVRNTFGGPIRERNVVAEIEGANPSGIVLLAGHFDSWDAAQGATDNGAGTAMALEAARVLKMLKIRPRNTIRFAFFSGEEQGLNGSRAYTAAHREELGRTWAYFLAHGSTSYFDGLSVQGREDLVAVTKQRIKPLAALGVRRIATELDFADDSESFSVVGVPTYTPLSIPVEHSEDMHHTIIDNFERIDPLVLSQQTAVLTAMVYLFANADRPPGPRISPAQVDALIRKYRLEHAYEVEHGPFVVRPTW